MTRTDTHRPSVIDPSEYTFVALECIKVEDLGDCYLVLENRERRERHMAQTGGTYSRHAHGGNCHICGAHAIYTALFYHEKTNSYIRTGMECAEKLDCFEDFNTFRTACRDALELQAGKRKARAILDNAGLSSAWTHFETKYSDGEDRNVSIARDIVGKLVQYGHLSEKQTEFLSKLCDMIARKPEIDAQRAAEAAAAKDVPDFGDKRVVVEGKVLALRSEDGFYGHVVKMLVQHAEGWKLWGNAPSSLDCKAGDVVRFNAKVSRSDRDPKFGFFARPTKAECLPAA